MSTSTERLELQREASRLLQRLDALATMKDGPDLPHDVLLAERQALAELATTLAALRARPASTISEPAPRPVVYEHERRARAAPRGKPARKFEPSLNRYAS